MVRLIPFKSKSWNIWHFASFERYMSQADV
jgi:hypothetical protein